MDLAPGTILASRYRVMRELGRGGMGAVYLAEHIATGNQVALKLLIGAASTDPDSIERFKREARAPAKIGSESVVKVLDADVSMELGGAPFLVMELLNGHDLQKLVRTQGRLPPQQVVDMLTQVARALDKSHQIGIVHRDLKPENLFLHFREDGSSVVKILDFGISKLVIASATSGGAMTRSGEVMGTPLYMSPEQAAGRIQQIGPASDIWSLGLIAVFLLTGEAYFQGTTIPDVLAKVLSYSMYGPSRRWPFLSPTFDTWLMQSCARDPAMRFRSAGEQMAALAGSVQADAPTLQAFGDLGVPRSGVPRSVPIVVTPAVRTEIAYGATVVGGSTNEPVMQTRGGGRQPAGTSSGLPVAALVLGVLVLFLGAVAVTVALLLRRASSDKQVAAPPPTETSVPAMVLDIPDAALAPLAPIKPVVVAPGIKPHPPSLASASASGAPASAPTATKPTADHKACVDDCTEQNPDDINAATECARKCPP